MIFQRVFRLWETREARKQSKARQGKATTQGKGCGGDLEGMGKKTTFGEVLQTLLDELPAWAAWKVYDVLFFIIVATVMRYLRQRGKAGSSVLRRVLWVVKILESA